MADDDLLKKMTAELCVERRRAEIREESVHDISVMIASLHHRGFVAEIAKGASAYQLSISIDLIGVKEAEQEEAPAEKIPAPVATPEPIKEEPTPADAPVHEEQTPAPDLPALEDASLNTEPFSEKDQAAIVDMTANGASDKEIAVRLNRTYNSIYNWKRSNRERLPAVDFDVPPLPVDERPTRRVIYAHLNALGYGWTPKRDLMLVHGLGSGMKTADVASGIGGVNKDAVLARWRQVNISPGDLHHQSDLIAVLKHRAGI